MYCIEAKAKKDIPLGVNEFEDWDNGQLKRFIKKVRTSCSEFDKALEWIGGRNYQQAVNECKNSQWVSWLRGKLPKPERTVIPKGSTITLTKGKDYEYALWSSEGIFDLPAEYVGETVRVVSAN
jgi:hypothetical protein